jgi:hypothetical protein
MFPRRRFQKPPLLPAQHPVQSPEALPPQAGPSQVVVLRARKPREDIERPGQVEDDLLDVGVLHSSWKASDDGRLAGWE